MVSRRSFAHVTSRWHGVIEWARRIVVYDWTAKRALESIKSQEFLARPNQHVGQDHDLCLQAQKKAVHVAFKAAVEMDCR